MKFIIHKSRWPSLTNWSLMTPDGSAHATLVKYHNNEVAIMYDLHVYPKFRKQGIGLALQKEREKIAKNAGATHVGLYVRSKETWKVEWYKRRGFEITEEVGNRFTMVKKL